MTKERRDSVYYTQPIEDALQACATGEFAKWTLDQHRALGLWLEKYPDALSLAASFFLSDHLPDSVRDQLGPDVHVPF